VLAISCTPHLPTPVPVSEGARQRTVTLAIASRVVLRFVGLVRVPADAQFQHDAPTEARCGWAYMTVDRADESPGRAISVGVPVPSCASWISAERRTSCTVMPPMRR